MLDSKKIGERLKTLRGNKAIREVADACGISISALGMYEIGERIPRDEIKISLARYYGTTIEALFFAD